jgi:hypothetical protein
MSFKLITTNKLIILLIISISVFALGGILYGGESESKKLKEEEKKFIPAYITFGIGGLLLLIFIIIVFLIRKNILTLHISEPEP